jgi:hypothetical protein
MADARIGWFQEGLRHVECISAKGYPKAKRSTHTLFVADHG